MDPPPNYPEDLEDPEDLAGLANQYRLLDLVVLVTQYPLVILEDLASQYRLLILEGLVTRYRLLVRKFPVLPEDRLARLDLVVL
jgi:hypothetical protein